MHMVDTMAFFFHMPSGQNFMTPWIAYIFHHFFFVPFKYMTGDVDDVESQFELTCIRDSGGVEKVLGI